MQKKKEVTMEFHISRKARDRYKFDETIFSITGNVIFSNFHAARVFAQRMNDKRDLIRFPEEAVSSGDINAMGLIDEIMHYVHGLYRKEMNEKILPQAISWLNKRFDKKEIDKTLQRFVDEFPPIAVYKRELDEKTYLKGKTDGVPNRQIVLEEMLTLWLANKNQAFAPFLELFDDAQLEKETSYLQIISSLKAFFDTQPTFGPDNQNLIDMLRSPAIAVPHSLQGQLEYIRKRWGHLLGKYLYKLLSSLDLLAEEEKMKCAHLLGGKGPTKAYEFAGLEEEAERFSQDKEWMPKVVMIAKNIYVWIDQLSKKYQQPINQMDQIPDKVLDTLSCWGFTGLWLIGVWERSKASERIKRLCGNPEAVASAYSLYDYQIASDLGGEKAFQNLKDRCWKRGIRLASDMVPNHVGIDSKWVVEHPDWFISQDYSPFPSYSFNGEDLSQDERVGIMVEDHYYDRSDAAVVFKRRDRWTGDEKYIYHGNDGTHMPWNDTAQLNYLNAEVRESVIQTILGVARQFPIIRFDAAMTLAKKHFQRLWFPEPGTGGAIPSRAEHGLTKEQFDALIPNEFWREVVDRIAEEVPDTLLLAEAFWLMEGYFVRTLGMHRVYNSAFMNMLKNEENSKYRSVIKKTLEFDPEILKRYVNFMNNPDEETAVAQFGKDDKYFGVCMMMVTMPGLPMFGHGQVEGFSEKYGMEYRRAYWDEEIDTYKVERHEREIFPLMRKRYLFAEVENFLLYDFYTPEGHVNEDVFAYSNRVGDERTLVIYHNSYASTCGWIRTSSAYSLKTGNGDEKKLVQKNLGEGLELEDSDNHFCIFRDDVTGLEYIRNSKKLIENGLYIELGAYKYKVFLNFREVKDNEWHQYSHLTEYLDGRGVPGIDEALKEIFLRPIHYPFKELVNVEMFKRLMDTRLIRHEKQLDQTIIDETEQKLLSFLTQVKQFTNSAGDERALTKEIIQKLTLVLRLGALEDLFPQASAGEQKEVLGYIKTKLSDDRCMWGILFGWLFVHSTGKIASLTDYEEQSRTWIDEWLLGRIINGSLRDFGLDERSLSKAVTTIKLLTSRQHWFQTNTEPDKWVYQVVNSLLKDTEARQLLQINRHQDILWFNKEAFEQLLWWMIILAVIDVFSSSQPEKSEAANKIVHCYDAVIQIQQAGEESGYQVEKLTELLKG
ncbi:MAG: alpha-amylase family glycosyl hydrolase [Thermodesulfobacteriota bacterium]